MDFGSNHPFEHKYSVVDSLMHRAVNLSDPEFREEEINHVSDVLQNNGYPRSMIKKSEQKAKSKLSRNCQRTQINDEPQAEERSFLSIPYIPGISERLKRIFSKYDVKVAHKPTRKLRTELCKLKDEKTAHEKAGVVYRIDCGSCDAKYVGETGRQVKERMLEHQRDIRTKKPASKVYEHVRDTGHDFKFNEVSVLDNASHRKTRLHLESIHTFKETNSINRSLILNPTYRPLFS